MKRVKELAKKMIPWVEEYKKIENLYRKSYIFMSKGYKHIANYYAYKISKKYNCYISPKAEIGKNIIFPHPVGIVIGEGVKIGDNCVIYQNVTLGRKNRDIAEYPVIEDNVTIYCNSTIIGNVKVGSNSIIGCNTVVMKSIDNNSVCVGVVK